MWRYFDIGCGILVVLVLFFLAGCGPNYKVVKEYNLSQGSDIRPSWAAGQHGTEPGYTVNIMYLKLDADVKSTTTAEQRAANDVAAALGLNGSTPSLSGGSSTLTASDLLSKFTQWQENKQVTDTAEVVTPPAYVDSVAPVETEQPAQPATEPDTSEFSTTETHTLTSVQDNNKKFVWLPETGAYYGGAVQFEFPGCGDFTVPDAAVTIGADGSKNTNQAYYFCGTDFDPSADEWNHERASVFSPPGCPADTVIMHYNRE